MLIVSLLALVAFGAVFVQGIIFSRLKRPRRQADNCEVGFIMAGSLGYAMAFLLMWVHEPWKLTANSPASTMLMGLTIFSAAYFYRRIGAMIDGRERRKSERREEDESSDRRIRRPSE